MPHRLHEGMKLKIQKVQVDVEMDTPIFIIKSMNNEKFTGKVDFIIPK